MAHRYLNVQPELADFIRSVLVSEPDLPSSGNDLPLFTGGMPALVFQKKESTYKITFFGQSVPDDVLVDTENKIVVAYFFKPFALAPLFKITAHRLKQEPVALDLRNAQKAMALGVQLSPLISSEEMIETLDHFVLSQLEANKRDCEIIRYATDHLMQDAGTNALPDLLQYLNITERTFQRIFKKYVGITAGEYRRICQFQFAFSQLKGGHFEKLTDVAYSNGYYDQSHFIRSFKEFAHSTPIEYLQSGLSQKPE